MILESVRKSDSSGLGSEPWVSSEGKEVVLLLDPSCNSALCKVPSNSLIITGPNFFASALH